jgi:ribonuclease HI
MEVTINALLDKPLTVLNVYVPPSGEQKKRYLAKILKRVGELKENNYVVVAGDFNLVRSLDSDVRRNYKTQKEYRNIDNQFYSEMEETLVDSIAVVEEEQTRFTRRGERITKDSIKQVETRIDQVWVDTRLKEELVCHRVIHHRVHSDHGMLVITLKTSDREGPEAREPLAERTTYRLPDKGSDNFNKLVEMITNEWEVKKEWVDWLPMTNEGAVKPSETLSQMASEINTTVWNAVKQFGVKRVITPNINKVNLTREKIENRIAYQKREKRQLSKGVVVASNLLKLPEEARKSMLVRLVKINARTSLKEKFATYGKWTDRNLHEWIYLADRRRSKLNKEMKQIRAEMETKAINRVIEDILDAEDANRYLYFKRINPKKGEGIRAVSERRDGGIVVYTDSKNVKRVLAEAWRRIFLSRGPKPQHTPSWLQHKKHPIIEGNLLKEVTVQDTKQKIKELIKGKSPGEDGITGEMLKVLPDTMIASLTVLYNECLKTGEVPEQWQRSRISLIYKEGSIYDPSNYRPISLLSIQYKMFTKILADRLSSFMERNRFLSNDQLGYRHNRDTIEGVLRLTTRIKRAKVDNKKIHVTYIDLYKAYNSVEHWAIEQTLDFYGIEPGFRKLVSNINKGGSADIITDYGTTESFPIEAGVRQGDSISPILFIIFMNPLLESLNEAAAQSGSGNAVTAYCDDVVLTADSKQLMEAMWKQVCEFAQYNNLAINPEKSGYSTNDVAVAQLVARTKDGEKPVKMLDQGASYKYLGIWVNLNLDWRKQTEECEKKLKNSLTLISFKKMSVDQKISLVNITIHTSIGYRMNVVPFAAGWLQEMDKIVVERMAKIMGIPVNEKNKNAIWALRGLHKLEHLQIAIHTSTMVDKVLNSTSTKADKDMVNVAKIQQDLRTLQGELLDTEEQHVELEKILGLFSAKAVANKLALCGIKYLAQVRRNGITLTYEQMKQSFAGFCRVNQQEWKRAEQSIGVFAADRIKSEKPSPHKRSWKQDELESERQKGKLCEDGDLILICTDGSLKENSAGAAVWLNNKWNKSLRVEGEQSILNAELQAIEWALNNVPISWKVKIATDSKNAINNINKFSTLASNKRHRCAAVSTLTRLTDSIRKRVEAGGAVHLQHIYSHVDHKLKAAKRKSQKDEAKWQNKIEACKQSWGALYETVRKGNDKADWLANQGRMKLQSLKDECLLGSPRWVVSIKGMQVDGNLMRAIKLALKSIDRNKVLKDESRYKAMLDPSVLQDCLAKRFSAQRFRHDKVNNWWFRMITNNLANASRFSHWVKEDMDPSDRLYEDPHCQECKMTGALVKDNISHMLQCPSERAYDDILCRRINKVINTMATQQSETLETWFPCTEGKHQYFSEFNLDWGARGYLPSTIGKFLLEERRVPKEQLTQCIARIDSLVKANRYARYKARRRKDRQLRKVQCLKEALRRGATGKSTGEQEQREKEATTTTCLVSRMVAGTTVRIRM